MKYCRYRWGGETKISGHASSSTDFSCLARYPPYHDDFIISSFFPTLSREHFTRETPSIYILSHPSHYYLPRCIALSWIVLLETTGRHGSDQATKTTRNRHFAYFFLPVPLYLTSRICSTLTRFFFPIWKQGRKKLPASVSFVDDKNGKTWRD